MKKSRRIYYHGVPISEEWNLIDGRYLEIDGIRLVVEDRVVVGWYAPGGLNG